MVRTPVHFRSGEWILETVLSLISALSFDVCQEKRKDGPEAEFLILDTGSVPSYGTDSLLISLRIFIIHMAEKG